MKTYGQLRSPNTVDALPSPNRPSTCGNVEGASPLAPTHGVCVEFRQSALEQSTLRVVVDQGKRATICVASLFGSTETAEQLSPRRMQVVVVLEGETIDDVERSFR